MDRTSLLHAESRNSSPQWLVVLGVTSTLCVAATVAMTASASSTANYVPTATRTQTGAFTLKQPGMRSQPASSMEQLRTLDARVSRVITQNGGTTFVSHSGGVSGWLAPLLMIPLSGFLGALAFRVLRRPAMAAMSGEKDMKVWNPINNKKFETFSYLPPLTDAQISKQVDMIIAKGLSPCLEFAAPEASFTSNDNTVRFNGSSAGYYDNRYWTMWKLPMFGCSDASQVLKEVAECRKAYPQCYVRLAAFDSVKQVQVISFLVQRP